jgi:hypothetical protein
MKIGWSRGAKLPLLVRFLFFPFGRFLDGHVVEFFGIEDVATFEAFDIFGVFVAGYNSNPWVFAGGNHRFDLARFDALAADCSGLLRDLKRQFSEIFQPSICARSRKAAPGLSELIEKPTLPVVY